MKRNYSVAGTVLEIEWDWEEPLQEFAWFEAPEGAQPEMVVSLFRGNGPSAHWYGLDYCQGDPEFPHLFTSRKYPRVRMQASRDWSRARVEQSAGAMLGVLEVLAALFYSYLSRRGGILLHASLVEYRGETLLFTADSGVGKTTQAELWQEYTGARILNGDKVILRWQQGQCVAWGSPWKGSSPYGLNVGAPLRGMVVLSQGKENRIRRLSPLEMMEKVLPHVFYPSWDTASTAALMDTLDRVLEKTPVWALSCRPDREAVELTRNTLWSETHD